LGSLAGKIWRVGLMGHSSCRKNIFLFLSALETVLRSQGVKVLQGSLEAASAVYGEVQQAGLEGAHGNESNSP